MADLPRFVTVFKDRHGVSRYRFRRAGFSQYLPNPGAKTFADEYRRCIEAAPPTPLRSPKSAVGQLRMLLREREWQPVGEFVYFLATKGMVKIGFSSAIVARVSQLSAQSPTPLRLLGAMQGGRGIEAELHTRFANDQLKGEWFKLTPEIRAFAKSQFAREHL